MVVALQLNAVAGRPALAQRKQQSLKARRGLVVRNQAVATEVPPATGAIKGTKEDELAINGEPSSAGAGCSRGRHRHSWPCSPFSRTQLR